MRTLNSEIPKFPHAFVYTHVYTCKPNIVLLVYVCNTNAVKLELFYSVRYLRNLSMVLHILLVYPF